MNMKPVIQNTKNVKIILRQKKRKTARLLLLWNLKKLRWAFHIIILSISQANKFLSLQNNYPADWMLIVMEFNLVDRTKSYESFVVFFVFRDPCSLINISDFKKIKPERDGEVSLVYRKKILLSFFSRPVPFRAVSPWQRSQMPPPYTRPPHPVEIRGKREIHGRALLSGGNCLELPLFLPEIRATSFRLLFGIAFLHLKSYYHFLWV